MRSVCVPEEIQSLECLELDDGEESTRRCGGCVCVCGGQAVISVILVKLQLHS